MRSITSAMCSFFQVYPLLFLCLIISFNIFRGFCAQSDVETAIEHKKVSENVDNLKTENHNALGRPMLDQRKNLQKLSKTKSLRRGLLDNFPLNRGSNTSYLSATETDYKSNPPRPILFVALCLFLAAITQGTLEVFELAIPYQAMLLFYSMLAGILSKLHPTIDQITLVAHMMPLDIISIFLPVVILNSVFRLDTYSLKKSIFQVMIYGLLGFIIQVPLIGFIMVPLIQNSWDLTEVVIFGLICSITDPHEISKILNASGKFKEISAILQCEGSILLSVAIVTLATVQHLENVNFTIKENILSILQVVIGGILLGIASGWITKFFFLCLVANKVAVNILIISVAYILFYTSLNVLHTSPILCVLFYSMVLNFEKSSMSTEDEQNTLNILEISTFVAISVIFIMAGIVATEHLLANSHSYSLMNIFTLPFIYFLVFILRFAVLTGLTSFTKLIGYDINWREVPLLVFGGTRGAYSLCLSLKVNKTYWLRSNSPEFLVHVISLVFFSVLLNSFILRWLIRRLHTIDERKVHNMKLALKSIYQERFRAIQMLKTRKELAQTNWLVVDDVTKINFPYNIKEEADIMGAFWSGKPQEKSCPECRKATILVSNLGESRQQILERKKVQFRKCYNHGYLSNNELKKVMAALESAYDSPEHILEIKSIRSFWHPNRFLKCINDKLVKLPARGPLIPPTYKINQFAFRIYSFKYYTLIVYIINLISTLAFIALAVTFWKYYELSTGVIVGLQALFYFLFVLFTADFVIQVLSLSIKKYFKSYWNLIDFILLIMTTADIAVDAAQLSTQGFYPPSEIQLLNIWLRGLRTLHLLRCIKLLEYYGKQLYVFIDGYTQSRLTSGYTIAQCYIQTQEEIIRQLDSMYEQVDNEDLNREIYQKTDVLKELADINTNYPSIPTSVMTKHISRQILNEMMLSVNYLHDNGLIDDKETIILRQSINKQIKKASTMKLVHVFPPHLVIKQISWVFDDLETYTLLMNYSKTESYQQHKNIITAGEDPTGLKILVSGVATSKYVYSEEVYNNLRYHGHLPNCDFITNLNFGITERHEDVLYAGAVIGELGLLTNSKYNYTVECEMNTTVHDVRWDIISNALKEREDLEANIWKAVCIRVAFHISKSVFRFQKISSDKLRYILQTGFVPKLTNFKSLDLKGIADCCFLIQGAVYNPIDQTQYIAPTFIPETVRTLEIKTLRKKAESDEQNEREIKIFIIPMKDDEHYSVESKGIGQYSLVEVPMFELCDNHAQELAKKEKMSLKSDRKTSGLPFFNIHRSRQDGAGSI